MEASNALSEKDMPLGLDAATVEEYSSQSKLLLEFTKMPTINKAWVFKSDSGTESLTAGILLANTTTLLVMKILTPKTLLRIFLYHPF